MTQQSVPLTLCIGTQECKHLVYILAPVAGWLGDRLFINNVWVEANVCRIERLLTYQLISRSVYTVYAEWIYRVSTEKLACDTSLLFALYT